MNIAVYPTDHGYGHVTRQFAWIKYILKENIHHLYIISKHAAKIIPSHPNLSIIPRSIDQGLISNPNKFCVDINGTKKLLNSTYKNIPSYLQTEQKFLQSHRINAIITDISPLPIQAAFNQNIPSLSVSSFTWTWVYKHIHPNHPIIPLYKQMYQHSSNAYVLPLGENLNVFPSSIRKKIPLMANTNRYNKNIQTKPKKKRYVFISMGKSITPKLDEYLENKKIQFILPEHLVKHPKENHTLIPKHCINITSYLAYADYALIKTGYSSVAECIINHIPILGIKRTGINEDAYIGKWIDRLGVGKTINFDEITTTQIQEFPYESYQKKYDTLPKRMQNKGHVHILNWIKKLEKG